MNQIKKTFFEQIPFFFASPAVVWHVLFFYIPFAFIAVFSFMQQAPDSRNLYFTLENYRSLIKPLYLWVIIRSLLLAFFSALIALLIAYPVAYSLAVKIKRFKNLFLFFLILPFWTSLMVQLYSWFFILEYHGLINSLLMKLHIISAPIQLLNTTFAVYIVMVYCFLPFMILPLYTTLEKLDRRLFEAAADLGASQWQTFWRVTVPLSMPGIKTGFFLVFVPAFGEFAIPILMGGGKKLYVGSLIMQYYLFVRNQFKGAAFTMISSVVLVLAVIIIYLYFKRAMRVGQTNKGING